MNQKDLMNAIEVIKDLKADLFYQIEMKHGAEKASQYPSYLKAMVLLAELEPKIESYEPKGEFVNSGEDYELFGYVFETHTDGEGASYLEVLDFEGSFVNEIYGILMPDAEDLESIEEFESTVITWLKGEKLI